jgi:hypothetical protein
MGVDGFIWYLVFSYLRLSPLDLQVLFESFEVLSVLFVLVERHLCHEYVFSYFSSNFV